MRAGVLRHRVTIEEPATGTDEWGQPTQGWQAFLTDIPAEIRDIRGREFWAVQQAPTAEVYTRVRIRYHGGVTRLMRVRDGNRTWPIEAVIDPDGKRTELHLMCRGDQHG